MIRVGIGGWSYEPWRETFYPADVPKTKELEYASARLTAIEINATFYSTQKPATFQKWRDATPDGFMFSVKAPRAAVNRKDLADAADSIAWFANSGVRELGAKLGPILWQLTPYKKFEPTEMETFLGLMPSDMRHAIEVRHASFADEKFVALARKHKVAIVFVESEDHPPIADITADFSYARLEKTQSEEPTGYPKAALAKWVKRAQAWECGETPKDLPRVGAEAKTEAGRDVFLYFISGAKERAPAAAMATIAALKAG